MIFSMIKQIFGLFTLILSSFLPVRASMITLKFDVLVSAEFNYGTKTYTPGFQPFSIQSVVSFDDAVRSRDTYSNGAMVNFGAPHVQTPLTAKLPYGEWRIDPRNGQVAVSNADYGPADQFSQFLIVQSQYNPVGSSFWSYDLELRAPIHGYQLFNDLEAFDASDLLLRLQAYRQDAAQFSFSEYSDNFDANTMTNLGGIGYSGTAKLTDIVSAPEPSAVLLTFTGLAVMGLIAKNN